MAAKYEIDRSRRLVLTTASGELSPKDIQGHMDRLTGDPDFDPDFYQLADFTPKEPCFPRDPGALLS
jgi:hypothetical protein